jgi:hypothetical protein
MAMRAVPTLTAIVAIVIGAKIVRHSQANLTFSRFKDGGAVEGVEAPGSLVLFVNITNVGTEPVWFREKVQMQVGGHWSEAISVRWLCGGPTWPGIGEECIAAVVPSGAEAVRPLVDCRHATPYDAILDFLNRHGLNNRFPALRQWSYWGLANLGPISGWQKTSYQFAVPANLSPPSESLVKLHD